MSSTTDADLIRRLASDDATALEDVYRVHAARCRAVAHRTLGDAALAQDAVQEAFLGITR